MATPDASTRGERIFAIGDFAGSQFAPCSASVPPQMILLVVLARLQARLPRSPVGYAEPDSARRGAARVRGASRGLAMRRRRARCKARAGDLIFV